MWDFFSIMYPFNSNAIIEYVVGVNVKSFIKNEMRNYDRNIYMHVHVRRVFEYSKTLISIR